MLVVNVKVNTNRHSEINYCFNNVCTNGFFLCYINKLSRHLAQAPKLPLEGKKLIAALLFFKVLSIIHNFKPVVFLFEYFAIVQQRIKKIKNSFNTIKLYSFKELVNGKIFNKCPNYSSRCSYKAANDKDGAKLSFLNFSSKPFVTSSHFTSKLSNFSPNFSNVGFHFTSKLSNLFFGCQLAKVRTSPFKNSVNNFLSLGFLKTFCNKFFNYVMCIKSGWLFRNVLHFGKSNKFVSESVIQKYGKVKIIWFFLICCQLLIPQEAEAKCTGRFVNPITDICWECLFPVSIGSISLFSGKNPDTDNPASPICLCGSPVARVLSSYQEHL